MKLPYFLFLSAAKAAYDYAPIVPMDDYKQDSRTLDCWECFEAEGKMCSNRENKSMMQ